MSTGHERRDGEAGHAVPLDDGVDDDHERAGGPADLHTRAAERGNQEAGDDGGVDALRRRHAARDTERDRERQRDDADDHSGRQVVDELAPIVAPQRREQLGDERPRNLCSRGTLTLLRWWTSDSPPGSASTARILLSVRR